VVGARVKRRLHEAILSFGALRLGLVLVALGAPACDRAPSQTASTPAPNAAPNARAVEPAVAPSGALSATGTPAMAVPVPQLSIGDEVLPTPRARLSDDASRLVSGRFGVVASVEKQATDAGISILEAGGNAIDAAVATAFALAVTHPSAGNLGGGGFLLLKRGSVVQAVDFRENSPAALTGELFSKMIRSGGRGPASVGVPGTVAGLLLVHARHGALPLQRVLEPARRLAELGFVVGARQALTISWSKNSLAAHAPARNLFLPAGAVPKIGSVLKNPGLAVLIRRIAERGRAGFYEGPTADDIVDSLGTQGLLSRTDLARYEAKFRDPLAFDYLGFRVVTMPAPSGGGVALAQNLLQLQALEAEKTAPESATRVHLLAEASRRAQTERRLFVVDPDSLSDDENRARRARSLDPLTWLGPHPVDPKHATPSASLHSLYADSAKELEHTTHFSVVDARGDAVSCTVTLSGSFGSRVVTRETGVVLNNAVASFASVGENVARPNQRTVSSMTPTLLFARGQGFLALGSPGGDTIPSTLTESIVRLTADGEALASAVLAPRFHQGFVPDEIGTERDRPLPAAVASSLRALGHRLNASRSAIGDVHAAGWFEGEQRAFSDTREGGKAKAAARAGANSDDGNATTSSAP